LKSEKQLGLVAEGMVEGTNPRVLVLKLEDRLEAEQAWVVVAGIQFPSQVVGKADILHMVKTGEGKVDVQGVQGTGVVMADGQEVGVDPGFEVLQKLEVVLQKL